MASYPMSPLCGLLVCHRAPYLCRPLLVSVVLIDEPLHVQGSLGGADLDAEILDTLEGDSLAVAGEGLDGHHRGLDVGMGAGGGEEGGLRSAPQTAPRETSQHHGQLLMGRPGRHSPPQPLPAQPPPFGGPGHLGGFEAASQLPLLQQPLGDGMRLIMQTQLQLLHQRVGGGLDGVQGVPVPDLGWPVVFV